MYYGIAMHSNPSFPLKRSETERMSCTGSFSNDMKSHISLVNLLKPLFYIERDDMTSCYYSSLNTVQKSMLHTLCH